MNRRRRFHPIALHPKTSFAGSAIRFAAAAQAMVANPGIGRHAHHVRAESSDMSVYIMFAGKIVLLALAFARLG